MTDRLCCHLDAPAWPLTTTPLSWPNRSPKRAMQDLGLSENYTDQVRVVREPAHRVLW
jgi:hypothetical protein